MSFETDVGARVCCAFVCGGYPRMSMFDQKAVELNASTKNPQIRKSSRKITVKKGPFQKSSFSMALRTALAGFQF